MIDTARPITAWEQEYMPERERTRLPWLFTRDLSACTEPEMRHRWPTETHAALAACGVDFEARVTAHDPIYFIAERMFFNNVHGDNRYLYPPLHKERIARKLTWFLTAEEAAVYSGFLLLVQRDCFKTTFTQRVCPVFVSVRGKHIFNTDERIAMCHHKEALVSAQMKVLKEAVRGNRWFGETWPEFVPPPGLKEWGTKTEITWPCVDKGKHSEVSIMCAGLGASLAGFHYGTRFNSDLVTEDHIKSAPTRAEAAVNYDASRYTRDTLRFREVNDGTRYHLNDLYGRMIKSNVEKKALYDILRIQAIDDETGELSHPFRHTREYLDQLRQEEISRTGNDLLWRLQMQNDAKSTGITPGDSTLYRLCKIEDIPLEAWYVLCIDSAWKGQHNAGMGDFASGQVWALATVGSLTLRFLVDGFHSNEMDIDKGHREAIRLMRKYGILDVAYEEYGGHGLRTTFENDCSSAGVPVHLIDLKNKPQQKTQRMVAFVGAVNSGFIHVVEGIPYDLKEQLFDQTDDFPQCEPNDALDCAAFTSDPAIQEGFVPNAPKPSLRQQMVERARRQLRSEFGPPQTTRYCGV